VKFCLQQTSETGFHRVNPIKNDIEKIIKNDSQNIKTNKNPFKMALLQSL